MFEGKNPWLRTFRNSILFDFSQAVTFSLSYIDSCTFSWLMLSQNVSFIQQDKCRALRKWNQLDCSNASVFRESKIQRARRRLFHHFHLTKTAREETPEYG